MSTVKELADAEAARAEAEEPDEEETAEEEEPQPEPEPESQPEPEAVQRDAITKLNRENSRHEKRIAEIMGEDFALVYVVHGDISDGFTLQAPVAEPELQHDPSTEECPTCQGWGDVLTGARAERSRITGCPDCGGLGYKPKEGVQRAAPLAPLPTATNPSGNGDPRVEALKEEGYTVIPPFTPPVPTPGS